MKIALKKISIALFLFIGISAASAQKILTLEEAKQMALEKNSQIRIAQKNVDAAKAARIGAKASMFPGIGASVTGFYFGKPIDAILPGYGASASLGINEGIYNGGKVKLGMAAAQKEVDMREEQKVLSTAEVLLNIEKAYWLIASLNEKLSLATKYEALLQAFIADLDNSFKAGVLYKNDVLRVQVQLNSAELNLLKIKDNLAVAKLSLAQMIGSNDGDNFSINDSVKGNYSLVDDNTADAVNNRPEINLLKKTLEQLDIQTELFRSDYRPSIGVSANGVAAAGKKGINLSDHNSNFLGTYYGLLSINIPIWDGGATKQRIKAQMFKVSAQQMQLEETKQLISIEIRQAYLQLNESARRISLSNTSLGQAEENLRLSNDRFKAGTIISKDVLEAQNIWEQVNSDLIDAKVQYKIDEVVLRKAMGVLK